MTKLSGSAHESAHKIRAATMNQQYKQNSCLKGTVAKATGSLIYIYTGQMFQKEVFQEMPLTQAEDHPTASLGRDMDHRHPEHN